MVFRFLQSLFTAAAVPSGKYDEALLKAAIERVVDGTDTRVRAVSDYRKKLREPVERAIDHATALIDQLPPALPVTRRGFSTDPRLRAFFVSPEHLQQAVSFSQGIRNYLRQANGSSSLPAHLYAVMGMERREKTVLGMALEGDIIHQAVPQVTVSFSNHGVAFPEIAEQDTRRELKKRAFDHLIKTALQGLIATRVHRQRLEQQRLLLQQKAKTLKAGNPGLDSLLEPMPQNVQDFAALEERIQEIDMELARIRADSATIENHLERVASTLGEPEKHLRLEQVSLTLDHMNRKVPETTDRPANTVNFDEAVLGDGRKLAILFIRFPGSEILMPPDPFEEARRYLL
jgi:hypothetical protein